jgi:hypothetical protein
MEANLDRDFENLVLSRFAQAEKKRSKCGRSGWGGRREVEERMGRGEGGGRNDEGEGGQLGQRLEFTG